MSLNENLNTQESAFQPPNYTQIPNVIFDEWMPILSPASFKTLLCICRKTFGWHKSSDCISRNQLMKQTGLSKATVKTAIDDLIEKGLVFKICTSGEYGHCPNSYRLNIVKPLFENEEDQNLGGGRSNSDLGVGQNLTEGVGQILTTQKKPSTKESVGEEKGAAPPPPPPPKTPTSEILKFGKHVTLKKEGYESICSEFGKEKVEECFLQINDWIDAKGNKGYKDYAAAARNWIRRDSKTQKVGKTASNYHKNKAEVRTAQETLRSLGSPKVKQIYLLDTQEERFVIRLDTGARIPLELEHSEFLDKFLKMFNLNKESE